VVSLCILTACMLRACAARVVSEQKSTRSRGDVQDVTPKEAVRVNPNCDRAVVLYGFLRGCNLRRGQRLHLAGVGDVDAAEVEQLPDPCPLPETLKKRGLNEQVRSHGDFKHLSVGSAPGAPFAGSVPAAGGAKGAWAQLAGVLA
jgi:AARP2CN (NUC121) domain